MEEISLKDRWKQICDEYALRFAEKHGYDIEYELKHNYLWVADDPGTVCEICDMFVGMEDMRYDIDNNIPEENFEKWYWKNLDVYELTGHNYMNYQSFCKGCPDEWTEERLNKIKEAKKNVAEAQEALLKCIEEE